MAEALMATDATWTDLERLAQETQVGDAKEALAGAADILAEQVSDDPATRAALRRLVEQQGVIRSECALAEEERGLRTPYEDYYDFSRSVREVRPHAVLAMNRGEREGVLRVVIELPEEDILK